MKNLTIAIAGVFFASILLIASAAIAGFDVDQIEAGYRSIRMEKEEAMQEILNTDTGIGMRHEVREGTREVRRGQREQRRDVRRELRQSSWGR